MESLKLGMPLHALQAFGGVSAVAGLIVVHSLARAGFAGLAGGLANRYGAFVLGGALVSLSFGALLDAMPLTTAIAWICALFTALGAGVWWASRRVGPARP